jgi:hypothetical protein
LALIHKSAPVPPIRFVDGRLARELAYGESPTPGLRVAQSAEAPDASPTALASRLTRPPSVRMAARRSSRSRAA